MRRYPKRAGWQKCAGTGMPAPGALGPTAFGPVGPGPQALGPTGPGMAPTGVAGAQIPPSTPTRVAPTRYVTHPTRVNERHTATRYPVVNVFPSHTRNVQHEVCEYYCQYPHTESTQVCRHVIDHCKRC